MEQLSAPDAAARRWAARDLSQHPGATVALAAQLRCERDRSVRQVILTGLTQLGDEAAVSALVDCLRSEEASVRNEAVEAMKALPEVVAPVMGGLLADADPDVRIMAVNVLESLRHPQVEAWLIAVLENDAHVNVCATAVDLLSEVGSEASVPALGRLKQRFADEAYIRFAVDLALERIAGSAGPT